MKLVYLGGPITGQAFKGANGWREAAIERFAKSGITGLSPLRGKYYLEGMTDIPDHLDEVMSTVKGITTRDRWDCQRCDVMLVNFLNATKVSIGTCIEFGWVDSARQPIVVAMEDGNVHDHAMIREVAGFILPTIEEALSTVEAILS